MTAAPRCEQHNLHGTGAERCEVYGLPPHPEGYWPAVTDVPCPVEGCDGTVVWYEAGYVPGYRVCARAVIPGRFAAGSTVRHRFLAKGSAAAPVLVRDEQAERWSGSRGEGQA